MARRRTLAPAGGGGRFADSPRSRLPVERTRDQIPAGGRLADHRQRCFAPGWLSVAFSRLGGDRSWCQHHVFLAAGPQPRLLRHQDDGGFGHGDRRRRRLPRPGRFLTRCSSIRAAGNHHSQDSTYYVTPRPLATNTALPFPPPATTAILHSASARVPGYRDCR